MGQHRGNSGGIMGTPKFLLLAVTLLHSSHYAVSFTAPTSTKVPSLPNHQKQRKLVQPITFISTTIKDSRREKDASFKLASTSSATAELTSDSSTSFATAFDFDTTTTSTAEKIAADSFERIDDAIMGGISTSSLRDVPGKTYASWSGVCRIDGGGFCGTRTLPFREPLDVGESDGIFVDCRLASDDEPERRNWKVTLRTDSSRGEMVYQAAFPLPKTDKSKSEEEQWNRIKIPFSDFQLVRGPRVVVGAPTLNATGGIYQIGFSLSKFVIGVNTTELEGFRPGYFDLQLRRVGFYTDDASLKEAEVPAPVASLNVSTPETLTKDEVEKKRPLILKIIFPVLKLIFGSEKANRRKSAMKILTQKRGLSRSKAILFGLRCRAKSYGLLASLFQTGSIIAMDSFRTVVRAVLRLCLFYPVIAISRSIRFVKKRVFGMKVKELPRME